MIPLRDAYRLIDRLKIIANDLPMDAHKDAIRAAIEEIEYYHQVAQPLGQRLAMLLDAALPALDKEAAAEKRREEGKPMRQITAQSRAKGVREAIAKAEREFGAMADHPRGPGPRGDFADFG